MVFSKIVLDFFFLSSFNFPLGKLKAFHYGFILLHYI